MKKTQVSTKTRRSADQRIAELQSKIEGIKKREAAKVVRQSEEGKAFAAARRAVDKAARVAEEAKRDDLKQAAEAAKAILVEAMRSLGLGAPKPAASKPAATKPRRAGAA